MGKDGYFCSNTGCKIQRLIIGVALLIAIGAGTFVVYRCRTSNVLFRDVIARNAITIQYLDNALKELLLAQQNNWLMSLGTLQGVFVKGRKGVSAALSSLPLTKKLLFYVAAPMCASCIEREVENLKKLSDCIGKQRIFIIAKGYKATYLFEESDFKDYPHLYEASSDIFSRGNLLEAPLYLYVDKNNQIKLVHSATKSIDGSFASFFRLIRMLFKNDSLF